MDRDTQRATQDILLRCRIAPALPVCAHHHHAYR